MEGDEHCNWVNPFQTLIWMINQIKYLIHFKKNIGFLYYVYHKYTHNYLNLND
jgi:hypothetical protein